MTLTIALTFVMVFAVVLIAVSIGVKFFETQRKKHVESVLRTVEGAEPAPTANLLKDVESDGGGLQRLLRSANLTRRTTYRLQQAGLDWKAGKLFGLMAGMAMAGVVVGTMFPILMSRGMTCLCFGALGVYLPHHYVGRKKNKRMAKIEEQFPDALDFLARSMRAGHAFAITLEMVGEEIPEPLAQEFRTLFNEQNLGAPLEVAMNNFTERVPMLDARFFCSTVLLQRQTGGNLAEILNQLAHVIRERFRLKGQVKAASAHGKLTAMILLMLPIATALGLMIVAPGYMAEMMKDPDGRHVVMGAIAAQVLGHYTIRRIINIKV